MNDFDRVLEACLDDLKRGASTLDECLARYPEHASHLRPLLKAAARLGLAGEIRPSAAFKARTRAKLTLHMQKHPHTKPWGLSVFQKLAFSFSALIIAFLIAGTAYAQDALPGSSFYVWKSTSERVWRAVSPDPLSTDIMLLARRANEWIAVSKEPDLSNKASESYRQAEDILESAVNENTEPRILPAIEKTQKLLSESGIAVPAPSDAHSLGDPNSNNEIGGKEMDTPPLAP